MTEVKELNAKALADHTTNFFRSFSTHEKKYENGGVFWPIKKWKHEGFDEVAIEAGTSKEDIQQHPILGPCYRVPLMSKSEAGSEGTTKGDNMSFQSKLKDMFKGLENLHGIKSSSPAKADDASSSESSDSDDSSSSSDSRSKKKKDKKKKKKSKKNNGKKASKEKKQKQKEKEQAAKKKRKAAELEKEKRNKMKEFKKTYGPKLKIGERLLGEIQAQIADKNFSRVPDIYKNEILNVASLLRESVDSWTTAVTEGTAPSALNAEDIIHQATKTHSIVAAILGNSK